MELLLIVVGVFVVLVIVAMVKGAKPVPPVSDDRDGFEHAAARNAQLRDAALNSAVQSATVGKRHDVATHRVSVATIDTAALQILSLEQLPSIRARIKGSFGCVSDEERERYSAQRYLLVREPTNSHDENAIAIYGRGRKVGYVSAAKAAALAPLLDPLPYDAFSVGGAGTSDSSIQMWVDLPRMPELRNYLRGQ
ncbi:HIRAN domain-containing protein [Plantibacter sp. YIM 135249]|uniref:HIRAN domain-containing protein n=1 Tax=Plantibacter sp. YIM 135249 TaxID=3423918 RepID=UPI003D353565